MNSEGDSEIEVERDRGKERRGGGAEKEKMMKGAAHGQCSVTSVCRKVFNREEEKIREREG